MLRDFVELIKLKAKAFYWIGSAAIDRSGRTKHPGLVIAVARNDAHDITTQDCGGDARESRKDWDALFPGWQKSCILMIFYPTYDKPFTYDQYVASAKRQGFIKDDTPEEQIKWAYSQVRPVRILWVPATGMKRIPLRHFWNYWKDKNDYQRPQLDSCPGCGG